MRSTEVLPSILEGLVAYNCDRLCEYLPPSFKNTPSHFYAVFCRYREPIRFCLLLHSPADFNTATAAQTHTQQHISIGAIFGSTRKTQDMGGMRGDGSEGPRSWRRSLSSTEEGLHRYHRDRDTTTYTPNPSSNNSNNRRQGRTDRYRVRRCFAQTCFPCTHPRPPSSGSELRYVGSAIYSTFRGILFLSSPPLSSPC